MSSLGDPANPIHPSQSVSSTACQSPALPWEVIERTIDHCFGDRASLRAFSLTCSQLRPRSLFVLFINVDIQSAKQLKAFYDAVQAQPHLQPVVKSLSFPWDEASPSLLLSILPGLRQITFNKISFVITDHDRLSQSPLPSGDQRVTSLRSLFIQNASFPLQSTFLHFLSAFPNVENVTCERLSLHQDPLPEGGISCRAQLRTLNILRDVDERATELLVRIAQLETISTFAIGERAQSSMMPPRPSEDCQTSLTWWIPAATWQLQHALHLFRNLKQTAIREVTLVIWQHSVRWLHSGCRRPANFELFTALNEILLGYRIHQVLLTVPGGLTLNARKTISWSDEFSMCFRPLSEKWALNEDNRYSGKPGHDSVVTVLDISPDGRWVATASEDSTIILWDAQDASISQEWFAHDMDVSDLAFLADGRHLASAGREGKAAIWDISGSAHQVAALQLALFRRLTWSSNGACVASEDNRMTIQIWDGRAFQKLPLDRARTRHAEPRAFSADGRWLQLAYDRHGCHVWDVVSGTCAALEGGYDRPSTATFSSSSTHVAAGHEDGSVRVWDMAT